MAALMTSHPVWVCGLKLLRLAENRIFLRSHPVWVCGLKLELHDFHGFFCQSHPVWVCGLKLYLRARRLRVCLVTPCMGVWIETVGARAANVITERHTLYGCVDWNLEQSAHLIRHVRHTLYGCVDWNMTATFKFKNLKGHTLYGCVDWNITFKQYWHLRNMGHTLYGCVDWNSTMQEWQWPHLTSHPVWVCGLKLLMLVLLKVLQLVTPCMGVWIETLHQKRHNEHHKRHTLYGCVDWNINTVANVCRNTWSHPVWVCGLKHWQRKEHRVRSKSHTLYGCVDWNCLRYEMVTRSCGHTLYGCVDWNKAFGHKMIEESESHPVWVCGLKLVPLPSVNPFCCHTLYGCVDWNYIFHPKIINQGVTPCMGVWIETCDSLCCWVCPGVTPCMGVWIET